MENKEKVTVVIPSFNRYKYLKNALESVFSQTYENIEIIELRKDVVSFASEFPLYDFISMDR